MEPADQLVLKAGFGERMTTGHREVSSMTELFCLDSVEVMIVTVTKVCQIQNLIRKLRQESFDTCNSRTAWVTQQDSVSEKN